MKIKQGVCRELDLLRGSPNFAELQDSIREHEFVLRQMIAEEVYSFPVARDCDQWVSKIDALVSIALAYEHQ
jgi:hypothetical protein